MALFTDPNTLSPVQRVAATIGQSNDPYVNLGRALGLMGAVSFGGASTGTPYEQEMAFMNEFGQSLDWTDPTSIKKLSSMASDYNLTDLSGKLMEESFSLSRELSKAAAAATKDRDVSPMSDKNAEAIEKFLSSKEIEGGTKNYGLINDIHTWSQKKNWTYNQALEYLQNTQYQRLASDSWYRDYKLTPRDGEGTAAAIQQPTVGNTEEEIKKRLEALRAGK
jgi:hypothetical protein